MASGWREFAQETIQPLLKTQRGVQKRLASRLNMTPATLSRYLSGRHAPDPMVAVTLLRELGGDVYSLIGEKAPSPILHADTAPVRDEAGKIDDAIRVPEIVREVAAGEQRFPAPDDVAAAKVFWFRPDFIRSEAFGGHLPKTTWGKLAMVRLAKSRRAASSMLPTISPGAWLLVRLEVITKPVQIQPRGIYLVMGEDGGLAVKRVTYQAGETGGLLLLESDNRAPEYAATALRLEDHSIGDYIKAKVVWWSVMAREHE